MNESILYSLNSMHETCLYMVVNTSGYTDLDSVVVTAVGLSRTIERTIWHGIVSEHDELLLYQSSRSRFLFSW